MSEQLEVEAGKGANNGSESAPSSNSSQVKNYEAHLTRARIDEVVEGCHPKYCFLRIVMEKISFQDKKLEKKVQKYQDCPGTECSGCELKEIMLKHVPMTDRNFVQTKCVEKLKYTRETSGNTDIGWHGAWDMWFDEGFYQRFKQKYDPSKSAAQIFEEVIPQNLLEAKRQVQEKDPVIYQVIHGAPVTLTMAHA
jgi:hypothetical protein